MVQGIRAVGLNAIIILNFASPEKDSKYGRRTWERHQVSAIIPQRFAHQRFLHESILRLKKQSRVIKFRNVSIVFTCLIKTLGAICSFSPVFRKTKKWNRRKKTVENPPRKLVWRRSRNKRTRYGCARLRPERRYTRQPCQSGYVAHT